MNLTLNYITDSYLLADVREHCERYHYLHRFPDPRSLPFAYILGINDQFHTPEGRLWGLLVLKKLQHHKQRGLFGYDELPTAWQVLDVARVWINPLLQERRNGKHASNIASWMLAQLWQSVGKPHERLLRVQQDWLHHHPPRFPALPYHIRLLASYCELSHHQGTIYRAAGLKSIGVTDDDSKELYIKHLPQPRMEYQLTGAAQLPLFEGVPLVHSTI